MEIRSILKSKRTIAGAFGAFGLVFFVGCGAPDYAVTPKSGPSTRKVFDEGRATLISSKVNKVAVAPASNGLRSGGVEDFVVLFKNQSGREQIFSPANFEVKYTPSGGGASEKVVVYTYQDLVDKERRRQAIGAAIAGLGAVGDSLAASSAGYSNSYGTYSATTYAPSGNSYNTLGNFNSTTYDYGAAKRAQLAAQAKRDAEFSRLAERGEANLDNLSRTALKKQTVPNGRRYGGTVTMEMPKFKESGILLISVKVGSERHDFQFMVDKP